MKKVFTLLTLLLAVCSGAWATDYVVTATRTLSNGNKTSEWSKISANGGSAISGKTAIGSGMYFNAAGKCTLNGSQANVKSGGIMYLEVPSADAAGKVTIVDGTAADRYFETKSGGKVYTKTNNTLAFTSSDVVTIDGEAGYWLQLTSKSDCKFNGVKIDLTTGKYITILAVPAITVTGATGSVTIDVPTGASSVKYTVDGTEPSAENGTTYSDPFVADEGTIVKAIAIGDGVSYADSPVASEQVLLTGITIATPTFKQFNGTVLITSASPAAKIYYTIDGTAPTSSSTLYKYPFTLSEDATVKAVAVREGCTDSEVASIAVVAVSAPKTKTIVMGHGSFDNNTTNTMTGKEGDDAEGYTLSTSNAFQSGVQSNTALDRTFIKLPTNSQVTITLPSNVVATKLTLYSFVNGPTNATISGWSEVYGKAYTEGDAAYTNIPMGAFNDVSGFKDAPDVRTYALNDAMGSVTFSSKGDQLCVIVALDVMEDVTAATITDAGYATFVPSSKVSVPTGVKAYIATAATTSAVTLSAEDAITVIDENTPVIIKGAEGTYYFPISTADASNTSGNLLKAGPLTDSDGTNYYVLGKEGDKVGFGLLADGVELPATKAYIPASAFVSGGTPAPAFVPFFFGEMETTGVNDVRSKMADVRGDVFDLQGRKVANPTKGLYIVNGKKVAIK